MKTLAVLSLLLLSGNFCFSQNLRKIKECVVENGVLKEVEIDYNPATGDRSMVVKGARKNFYDIYPKNGSGYADGQNWFINAEPVVYNGKPYAKYGLPRVLSVTEIEKVSLYKQTGVYREAGTTGTAEVIYIPVRQGCEFQPYSIQCNKAIIEQKSVGADGMQFTVKNTGLTGKISYTWQSNDLQITKGQGTATITVNTKNNAEEDVFSLAIEATALKACAIAKDEFVVKKQATQANGWGAAERKQFMTECVKSSKLGEVKGTAYCSCMLEKLIKLSPDPANVQKVLKADTITEMAKQCLPSNN